MKEFKQAIPEGMQARVEDGCVVYTPIEVCPFEVGDVIVYIRGTIRIFEGVNDDNCVLSSMSFEDNVFKDEGYGMGSGVEYYTKATPEQEKIFNQKCLENGVWFDKVNKEWIELKDGSFYSINFGSYSIYFIFKKYHENTIQNYVSLYSDNALELDLPFVLDYPFNISETTEEENKILYDAVKLGGKQWNPENKCVECIKWEPNPEQEYWFIDSFYKEKKTHNELFDGDMERISIGNCFKTQEEAEKYAQYMRECSKNYKPE